MLQRRDWACGPEMIDAGGLIAVRELFLQVAKESFHLANLAMLPDCCCFTLDKTQPWSAVMAKMQEITSIPPAEQLYWVFRPLAGGSFRPSLGIYPMVRLRFVSVDTDVLLALWLRSAHSQPLCP
jgi:hypothetical protein